LTPRIAILGGTFDPVHNAHLAIARAALAALGAEKILWMPTGAPGYRAPPVVSGAHRIAMLKLALGSESRYAIDDRELRPEASGFTFDTVSALKGESPGVEFVLIMGADQYGKRHSWHRWSELEKLCRVAVVDRPEEKKPQGDFIPIPMAPAAISASDIRARLKRGGDVSAMLPAAVLDYIRTERLYL